MSEKNSINHLISRKIRRLRSDRGMKLRQVAARAGIPLSSYACLESGQYNINLDNLFRILGALEADIEEVWPAPASGLTDGLNELYLLRKQSFRVAEVIDLSRAEGGALFALRNGKCTPLIEHNLSDFLIDRLILCLQCGQEYPKGQWFRRMKGNTSFHFFLKAHQCPDFVKRMIQRYMVIWSNSFLRE
jgi:transcriptional regulator with XRE-family HTH domain